jgi:hypothetical protein
MRRLALLVPFLLAACSQSETEDGGEAITCALDGAEEFKPWCRVERSVVEGKAIFVVRHPDGAFRRLEAGADGQNLLAADGAFESQSALKGDRYEVILGDDRYVIPVQANVSVE